MDLFTAPGGSSRPPRRTAWLTQFRASDNLERTLHYTPISRPSLLLQLLPLPTDDAKFHHRRRRRLRAWIPMHQSPSVARIPTHTGRVACTTFRTGALPPALECGAIHAPRGGCGGGGATAGPRASLAGQVPPRAPAAALECRRHVRPRRRHSAL